VFFLNHACCFVTLSSYKELFSVVSMIKDLVQKIVRDICAGFCLTLLVFVCIPSIVFLTMNEVYS
jgi:hypothetical protein